MKYLCDGCGRLVEVGAFHVRDGQLALACPACQHESRGGTAPQPAPVLELARPRPQPAEALCPKCAAPRQPDRDSCPRCGLIFELFNPHVFSLPPEIEALWARLEQTWTDPGGHDVFLAACNDTQLLGEAVRRYRLKAEQAPSDALAARYRDDAVARLLVLTGLSTSKPDEKPADRKGLLIAIAAALAIGMIGLAWLLLRPNPVP